MSEVRREEPPRASQKTLNFLSFFASSSTMSIAFAKPFMYLVEDDEWGGGESVALVAPQTHIE